MKLSNVKNCTRIAAICCVLYGIYIAIVMVGPPLRLGYYPYAFMSMLYLCGLIGLGAAQMLRKEPADIAAAGVVALYWVYRLIIWFCAGNILGFLTFGSLLLILVCIAGLVFTGLRLRNGTASMAQQNK